MVNKWLWDFGVFDMAIKSTNMVLICYQYWIYDLTFRLTLYNVVLNQSNSKTT